MGYSRFESLCENDPRGCPFAIFDFRAFPGAWKEEAGDTPFHEPFFKAFKTYRSPALLEPNVWLWIVKKEKSAAIVQLYISTMNLQYDLYHNTYIPTKTEGITVVQESRGSKQVGAVQLYFLTHKSSQTGRLPIKANEVFKKNVLVAYTTSQGACGGDFVCNLPGV